MSEEANNQEKDSAAISKKAAEVRAIHADVKKRVSLLLADPRTPQVFKKAFKES